MSSHKPASKPPAKPKADKSAPTNRKVPQRDGLAKFAKSIKAI